ncbi:hypothetical protein G6O67_000998 [Ophiocordyceps sinensis]|uniref:Pentatricopeptide repeat domain-containing protein n=2 Tax=Ophiocordyceps sinensis TaxID=72228 RepID=A0A8H4V8E5_9HYPO|nr:hypothetical protein G6O67_000998 [Ophiocordyceps sinensis]
MLLGIKSAWRPRFRCVPAARGAHLRRSPRLHSTQASEPEPEPPTTPTTTTHTFQSPYTGGDPRPRMRGAFAHSNHARNEMLRLAFRDDTPAIREDVKHKLSSPFVPPARDYPVPSSTQKSMEQALKLARVHVGFDLMTSRDETCRIPDWVDIFDTLKRATPKIGETPSMAALRIVMPDNLDMAIDNRKVEFIDAQTCLVSRLRMAVDHMGPSSFFLRGQAPVLARAADELIAACKDIQIFKLGDTAAYDYETKQLWPAITDALNGGLVIPADKLDNMWIHREHTKYWIARRYEKTPRPLFWTKESFDKYVTTLVCGRLRPHMALAFYGEPRKGRLVDTEGVRIGLVLAAFEDPAARDCITPCIVKMALAFMAQCGGHRASAERLFAMAEDWGIPMDTEFFNIMLEGYVSNNDVALFFKTLRKMVSRFFQPNVRTWLLYLKLVQKDDKRRQIVAAMYELGFFDDPATRRGIAEVMTGQDAYTAFKANTMLEPFMANQAARYGEDWLTPGALNGMLSEFLRFWQKGHRSIAEFRDMMDKKLPPDLALGIDTYNIIFDYCANNRDWATALWAIGRVRDANLEPDPYTYQMLLLLARNTRSASAFGIIFFYAVLGRRLRTTARQIADEVLLGETSIRFFRYMQPRIFNNAMARALEASKLAPNTSPSAGAEWAILNECEGYTPVQSLCGSLGTAIRTLDGPVHQKLYVLGEHPATIRRPKDYAIKMFDLRKRRATMVVHLDSYFRPETMMRYFVPKPDKPDNPDDDAPPAETGADVDGNEAKADVDGHEADADVDGNKAEADVDGNKAEADVDGNKAEAGANWEEAEDERPPPANKGASPGSIFDARARRAARRFRPHIK